MMAVSTSSSGKYSLREGTMAQVPEQQQITPPLQLSLSPSLSLVRAPLPLIASLSPLPLLLIGGNYKICSYIPVIVWN